VRQVHWFFYRSRPGRLRAGGTTSAR